MPVWQQKFDALWLKAKADLDGGAEIDREIQSVFLGNPFASTAGTSTGPDFANNWRYVG